MAEFRACWSLDTFMRGQNTFRLISTQIENTKTSSDEAKSSPSAAKVSCLNSELV